MKKQMSKKKLIKTIIMCVILLALLAGLITLMVMDMPYGTPDKLGVGNSNFGQRMWIGVQVSVLGMGTVFLMLFLLILCVNILRYIMEGAQKVAKKRAENKIAKQQQISAPEAVLQIEGTTQEEEIVVAITAAVAAYYDAQEPVYKSNLKFRVRSIKEI